MASVQDSTYVVIRCQAPQLSVEIDGVYLESARTRSPLNILDIAQFTRPYVLVLVQQEHRDPGSVDEFAGRRVVGLLVVVRS